MTQVYALRNLLVRNLRSRAIYTAVAFTLILCSAGWSQSTTGSIPGIVTDPSGAVLPNATVTVTNENTGAVRTVVTNTAGTYTLPNLPPGNYQAEITASVWPSTVNTT